MFNKILAFYTKWFAVWVVLFGVVAYFWPGLFLGLRDYNELFFGLTMFGIGAVLSIDDFKGIGERPIITPVLTKLLAGSILPVPFWPMFLSVIKMVILPLGIGFLVRSLFKQKYRKSGRGVPGDIGDVHNLYLFAGNRG